MATTSLGGTTSQDCGDMDLFNPLLTMGTQMFAILVIAQLFQLVLKPLSQPGPIAQILAGIVLGPTVLSLIPAVRDFFLQTSSAEYYRAATLVMRQVVMFVIGLEIDIPSMKRNLKPASTIALASSIVPAIMAAAISPYIFSRVKRTLSGFSLYYLIAFMMIIANTASPLVARLMSDLKLSSSSIGQLATCSSLSNEITLLIMLCLLKIFSDLSNFGSMLAFLLLAALIDMIFLYGFYRAAKYLNSTHRDSKYLTNAEVLLALAILLVVANVNESLGQNSMIPCFLLGFMLPRDGKTTRTLLRRLTYPVYIFLLPVYFGYTGFQVNIPHLWNLRSVSLIVVIVLVSIGGKMSGTLVAYHYLNMPLSEGIVHSLLLSVKGFTDLLIIDLTIDLNKKETWVAEVYHILLAAIVINTVIAGAVAAFIVKRESNMFGYRGKSIEMQSPESEMRMLACVHDSRHVWTMVALIATMTGSTGSSISPNLIHLIELPERNYNLTYHEQEDEDEDFAKGGADNYGGNDVVEINEAVDDFIAKTGVTMRQMKIVSTYETMYEDVCNNAEDLRASMVLVTFHKHQRIDGRMENGKKEGIRTANQKILRHAPCSVAILVDKGGLSGSLQVPSPDLVQHIAALFFGGPDDREALSCSRLIGMHAHINLTVIRFLHTASKKQDSGIDVASHRDEELLMAMPGNENETSSDNAFISDFFNRYVTSGQIGFIEKYVNDGAETAKALKDMGDTYSLFIVGKGGREHSTITTGMSDWEECPELGKIGDLLGSSELDIRSSVLVIQQHKHSINNHSGDY